MSRRQYTHNEIAGAIVAAIIVFSSGALVTMFLGAIQEWFSE